MNINNTKITQESSVKAIIKATYSDGRTEEMDHKVAFSERLWEDLLNKGAVKIVTTRVSTSILTMEKE